jgi:hypothetical protein
MKNGDAKVGKVPFAQPHDADPQNQGIETMKPPEFGFMAPNPFVHPTVEIRVGTRRARVYINHMDR